MNKKRVRDDEHFAQFHGGRLMVVAEEVRLRC
jgi:hypothetical protein